MAVQVWIGEKPEHPNERRTIVALANGLERLDNLYLLLTNFSVGGRTIDLAIIKRDAIFIVELKHCDGKIFGGVNGPWILENANGERKQLNPGRSNPYNQVISCYYSLTNFLNEHRAQFLSSHKAATVNFRSCRRTVVIAPTIEPGSKIELDWKVEVKGLDELPAFLVTERSAEIELTEEEMLAIPRLLKCTRWHDINKLIVGVLPSWQTEEPGAASDQHVAEEPAGQAPHNRENADSLAPRAKPASFIRQTQAALGTSAGRVALVMSLLVVLLLAALIMQLPSSIQLDQPRTSLVSASVGPAGGTLGGIIQRDSGCVWTGFQSVGKRWDSQEQQWINVGVDGTAADLTPEVVVTLEKVDYCNEHIKLSWSVRNNSSHDLRFSLQHDNISIRDPMGNTYAIDDTLSRPRFLLVQPGKQGRGTAVVPEPVIQNVPSLLVRLKEQPFGEASWLISLQEN